MLLLFTPLFSFLSLSYEQKSYYVDLEGNTRWEHPAKANTTYEEHKNKANTSNTTHSASLTSPSSVVLPPVDMSAGKEGRNNYRNPQQRIEDDKRNNRRNSPSLSPPRYKGSRDNRDRERGDRGGDRDMRDRGGDRERGGDRNRGGDRDRGGDMERGGDRNRGGDRGTKRHCETVNQSSKKGRNENKSNGGARHQNNGNKDNIKDNGNKSDETSVKVDSKTVNVDGDSK